MFIYTPVYCMKCAHPHRFSVRTKGEVLHCPTKGCRCRKFTPLPNNPKVYSLAQWKEEEGGKFPPPSTPMRMRKWREPQPINTVAVGKMIPSAS